MKQRVLEILRRVGVMGIHSFDLIKETGTWKSPARISDLRKEGYNITSDQEKKGNSWGVRYRLHEEDQIAMLDEPHTIGGQYADAD